MIIKRDDSNWLLSYRSSRAVFWKLIHSLSDLSSGPFYSSRLRLVKGPDERSLNYELISKTQHLKKKSVDYL